MRRLFIFIIVLISISFSCKKNKDTSPPVINISSPTINQQYSALDSIHITGTITDESSLSTVTINFVDENQRLRAPSIHINPGSNMYSLDYNYILDDIHLETGKYTLQIAAEDGSNSNKVFIDLMISGIPTELSKIYVFCNNTFNNTDLYEIDLSYNKSYISEFDYQLQDAETNSHYQQLSLLNTAGSIFTYNTEDMQVEWSASTPHTIQLPFQGKLDYIDRYIFESTSDQQIYSYDNNGTIRKTATIESNNHVPGFFTKHSAYLFVACVPVVPVLPKIEKLNYETGYAMNSYEINMDILQMFDFNLDNIIIWGNQNNVIKVCTLSVQYNVLYEINDFNQEKLNAVAMIDPLNYVLSSGNSVYTYNSNNALLNEVLINCKADQIFYNAFIEKLFIVKSQSLLVYSYPDFTLIQDITFPDDIIDICFLYNK